MSNYPEDMRMYDNDPRSPHYKPEQFQLFDEDELYEQHKEETQDEGSN